MAGASASDVWREAVMVLIFSLGFICLFIAVGGAMALNVKEIKPHKELVIVGCSVLICLLVVLGIFAYEAPPESNTVIAERDVTQKVAPAADTKTRTPAATAPGPVVSKREKSVAQPATLPTETTSVKVQGAVEPTALVARSVGDTFQDCDACPKLVILPAGDNDIGVDAKTAGARANETPLAWIKFEKAFAFGQFEVTRAQFEAFAKATDHTPDTTCNTDGVGGSGAAFDNPAFDQESDHPVVCVNFDDAQAYTAWLSAKTGHTYFLPSETVWEYARLAETSVAQQSPWLDPDVLPEDGNMRGENWWASTVSIGTYHANPFLVFDMMGNAGEWTRDCWQDNHMHQPKDGSAITGTGDCAARSVRGGSWDENPRAGGPTVRRRVPSTLRDWRIGFRVMREIDDFEVTSQKKK
ncbi:MAG: SUMF1/EgtB/PvdO family nonheme iron enzyme [Pseudomonadota bacterium]